MTTSSAERYVPFSGTVDAIADDWLACPGRAPRAKLVGARSWQPAHVQDSLMTAQGAIVTPCRLVVGAMPDWNRRPEIG